ncbi:hypothetical protein Sbs19_37180 [Sphingobium sp. BS19]|nr:hypothetical protein Sbs19_37180 [Sphingobium sp. BS19]
MPVIVPLVRILMIIFGLMALPETASAACTVSAVSGSLGTQSSYSVQTGGAARTKIGAGFTCSGALITLVSSNSANATMTTTNQFKLKRAGSSDAIQYAVSADPGGTLPFSNNSTVNYMSSSTLALLGILDQGNFAPSIYILPQSGANVSAGTYTDTMRIDWVWSVCHGVNVLGICILSENGTGTALVTLTMIVSADCRISVQPISFGSAALVDQFTEKSGSFAVDCTKDSTFSISVTNGNSGASTPWRKMSNGSGGTLDYNIYWADGHTIWNAAAPVVGAAPGIGAAVPGQNYLFKARINPAQIAPPAGHYTDLVSVLVMF